MYSQFNQDDWVVDLLHGKRNGFFLDTGAADGLRSSNTLVLERNFGWQGLCVEPNPFYFDQLTRNRRCQCIDACLYDDEREVRFLDGALTLGGVIEDFTERQLEFAITHNRLQRDINGNPPSLRLRTKTLRQVLDAAAAPRVIDYWSLDVEGTELRLLRSFPFDAYKFNAISVEHNGGAARASIREFLESRGFEFDTSLQVDDCFVQTAAFPHRHSRSRAWRRGFAQLI